uniref:Pro-opiomelanocortin n=2 Tax=Amphiuma TaxID=8311 RepID=Q6YIR6_AMPME|nr:pro-opiomelanocortin [Amphiuma means]
MLRPVWSCLPATLGALLCQTAGANSQCWESSKCRDLATEGSVLECIKACKVELSAESPVYPGNGHMQPLSENIRKYVMSHFRWNKFGRKNSTSVSGNSAGNKREELSNNPIISLFTTSESQSSGADDGNKEGEAMERQDSKRSYSMEHFRWGKPVGRKRRPIKVYPNGVEEESSESYPLELRRDLSLGLDYPDSDSQEGLENNEITTGLTKKNDKQYRIGHFRWGSPLKDKRYGGFMTPERSQTPLMTLFKNAIKNAHKKGQ